MMPTEVLRVLRRALAALLLAAAGPAWTASTKDFDQAVSSAKSQMMVDTGAARESAIQARQLAQRGLPGPDREQRIATADWLIAEAFLRANDVDGARPAIARAVARMSHFNTASKLKGDIMMSQGGVHAAEAKVGAALADYQQAFDIFRTIGEVRSQSVALATIGTLYVTGDDAARALEYFERASDIYGGDPTLAISIHNNRGFSLKDLNRYDEAAIQFAEALTLARQLNSDELQSRILGNIARLEIARGRLASAESAIARGLQVAEPTSGWRPQLQAIAAEIAFKQSDLATARRLIMASFEGVSLKTSDPSFREAHYTAYEIYRALGEERLALAHIEAMKRLDDKIWKLTASTNTALMAARFDSANQEARLARADARFQRTVFGGIALGAAIVFGLLGFNLWQSQRARLRLRGVNTELKRALAAKTEFLATTSHEIRTPLNGILGMTEVMLADAAIDPAARERLGIVHGAGQTMRALVDDILDVAKMESGKLTVEAAPFDIHAMLSDVAALWADQARAKGLDFRLDLTDCPRGVTGDAGRLRQLAYNLLSNAVKFTEAGAVAVTAARVGERLVLSVADTGVGIAADKHAEIFESFKQADSSTARRFGGTGLGLAIVRNIATAMGGSVALSSAPGAGATFTVDLPFEPADLQAPIVAAPVDGGLLIVERNPIARAMLKAVLEPRAGRVIFAASGGEAVALIGKDRFDRILIDEATARADGGDPVAMVAAVALAFDGPVAVLWACGDEATHIALVAAGAALVIGKPIAGPALGSTLYACNTDGVVVTQAA